MKVPRETVGVCDCFICGRVGQVRKDKNGKFYYLCAGTGDAPGCGKITPNLPGGQAALSAKTRPMADAGPAVEPEPERGQADAQAETTAKKPTKIFDW